ncbi:MAG: hypothetical protein IAF08_08335, partial [Rhizobacter sp.]|nr:hypothetical protein [Chlorobiales bacterium]
LQSDSGLFAVPQHAINYLESHDDNTMSDFIRIATGEAKEGIKVKASNFKLSERQLALNKLAALYLFAAQGPVMIHEGQEFARSKVVAATTAMDTKVGTIDHNSYEKDNETNYLNYEHRELNRDLYDYYRGLIALRKTYPSLLGSASKAQIMFAETKSDFMIACRITAAANIASFVPPVLTTQKDTRAAAKSIMVLLNGHQKSAMETVLPAGNWRVLANAAKVSTAASGEVVPQGKISVPPVSGMILIEE